MRATDKKTFMQKFYLKKLFVTIVAVLCCTMTNAHDFLVKDIYYKYVSKTDFTVEVTFEGSSYSSSKKPTQEMS